MRGRLASVAAGLLLILSAAASNVVFILTDDMDEVLGAGTEVVMPKAHANLISKGARFNNSFIHVPICCPSRAAIQTGRTMTNNGVIDNSCGGTAFQKGAEKDNMASMASRQLPGGFNAGYSGKYLNTFGFATVGGCAYKPPGWKKFYGLVGNSRYYNYEQCVNGQKVSHGSDYHKDYFTDLVKNQTVEFIRASAKAAREGIPFLAMAATPAPHVPNVCAPQYCDKFPNVTAPRVPSWNKAPSPDKHWMMRQIPPMGEHYASYVSDGTFADRWRALQSVDDLVQEVIATLETEGILNDTYVIFGSDHGQHLGEFGEAFDKRQAYETDVRIPTWVRGPGIAAGQERDEIISSIDFAPTILDMFGVDPNPTKLVDGMSWLPLVQGNEQDWAYRTDVLVEYGGPTIVPPADAAATPEQRRLGRAIAAARRWAREFPALENGSGNGTASALKDRFDPATYEPLLRAAVHLDTEGDQAERIAMALQLRLDRRNDEASVLEQAREYGGGALEAFGGGVDGHSEGMDELDEVLLDLGLLDAWQQIVVGGASDDDYPTSIPGVTMCGGERGKCPCDASNNTYACVRSMTPPGDSRTHAIPGNYIYCQYNDDESFVEYYDLDKDPWNTQNVAGSTDKDRMEALAGRLRNFMSCKGADECRDPHGLWPPPMPAGSQKITRDGSGGGGAGAVCLEAVGNAMVSAAPSSSCYAPSDAWVIGTDKLGHGQVKSSSDGLCLNLENVICDAGQPIHLYACQGDDSRIHTADHFKYDAGAKQLQMTECPGMCLGYDESAVDAASGTGAPVTLQHCSGGPGTTGWTVQ